MSEDYLIYSYEHSAWWAANSMGYRSLEGAGLYTAFEASTICFGANQWLPKGQVNEVMVHRSLAEQFNNNLKLRTVKCQKA
jgi:hypothetical protein